MYYLIVSTSKCKYQEWQIRLMNWSRKKVDQTGKFIVLLSEDKAHENEETNFDFGSDVEVIHLPDWAGKWKEENDDWWGGIPNKFESFNWLADYYPFNDNDILLFLDPDMIFLEPVDFRPRKNEIIGQKWVGYRQLDSWPNQEKAFMYPFVLRYATLNKIKKEFREYCITIREQENVWESDMWALDFAAKDNDVKITYLDRFGVCTNWKSNDGKKHSAIVHFPNVIESQSGKKLFFKQDYTFDPDADIRAHEAKNDATKKLLLNIAQERTDYIYHLKWKFDDIFKNYSGSKGYLILKPWPGGFNNIRMSLELGVCLAYLTDRILVLPSRYKMYLCEGQSAFEDFFDLTQLGISHITFTEFCEIRKIPANEESAKDISKVLDYDAVQHVVNFERVPVPIYFKKQRDVLNDEDLFDNSPNIFLDGNQLGNFYQSIYTSYDTALKKLVAKHVIYRNDIFDLAWEFINYFGDRTYYAIHIRRNDFQYKHLYISCEDILAHLKDIVPKYATLYIATDHRETDFFAPLENYYNVVYYQTIADQIDIEPDNVNWIPIIEQLICTRSIKFVGMKLSTLSSYVYRMRGYMEDIEDKNYYLNGEPFIETKQRTFREDQNYMSNWCREYKCSWDFNLPSIFVSIASYCDSQLVPTIKDALEEASNPERIIFGVHIQDTEKNYEKLLSKNFPNLRVIHTLEDQSKGAVWARNRIKRELFKDEDFFMQIDSHSRFLQNWDNILVNQFLSIEEPDVVMTTYPNAFEISDKSKSYLALKNNSPLRINRFLTDYWEENRLRAGNHPALKDYEIKPSHWCAAGFTFTTAKGVKDVVVPDNIIFNGEEDFATHLSVLKGYNLRITSECCVWHNYNNKNEKTGRLYKKSNSYLKGDDSMRQVNDLLFGYSYAHPFETLESYLNWRFKYLEGYARTFVCIAAYLEEDIRNTIEDCLRKSRYPDKISFGICWQYSDASAANQSYLDDLIRLYDIKVVKHRFEDSQGVGWARYEAMNLYANQKYVLQIDAHTRFVENWDQVLIESYRNLKKISDKPIISYLPHSFSRDNASQKDVYHGGSTKRDAIYYPQISGVDNENMLYYSESSPTVPLNAHQHISILVPSFVFTEGVWYKEVPPDPDIYYMGAELALSMRSFSFGFDIYTPNKNVVWHRSHSIEKLKHYYTHDLNKVKALRNRSVQKVSSLIEGTSMGQFGLGSIKTFQEFEQFAGLNFKQRTSREISLQSYRFRNSPLKLGLMTRCKDEFFIEEFCNYYIAQGVDRLHIVDDDSHDKSIYDKIIKNPKVKIHFEKDITKVKFINKLYKRIKDDFEWMIYVDVDEFIASKKHEERTIREELLTTFKNTDCIKVPWVMMSSNGQVNSPKSILESNIYRWNHDLKHENKKTKAHKFRCRYDKIEVKCIFKTKHFDDVFDHHPKDVVNRYKVNVVDSTNNQSSKLGSYRQNLRETDINDGFLVCYHYRIISEEQCASKLQHNAWYRRRFTMEDLMSTDYPELEDLTMRSKSVDMKELLPLELLTIFDLPYEKIRLGKDNDGGYIIHDGLEYDMLVGCGIGRDASFEEAFCKRYNVDGFAFDGTVTSFPEVEGNIQFIQKNIAPFNSEKNTNLIDLIKSRQNVFLKMDIEGAEFDWILSTDESILNKISQLVIEFHKPFAHWKWRALKKLTTTHYLGHVHPNNCCGVRVINGVEIPQVFECTFIRKRECADMPKPNSKSLPTSLDMPNIANKEEIELKGYPFVRSSVLVDIE